MIGLSELGAIGLIVLIILILLLPLIITVLVGIAFANYLGFTGIYWWSFVILFYLIVGAILGAIAK